jgi:hypothetical protein
MDFVCYIGAHKPRGEGTKNMEEVKKDPEGFNTKMDVSVFTYYNRGESVPLVAAKMPTLMAGIIMLNALDEPAGKKTSNDLSMVLLKMWLTGRNDLSEWPYIEYDPNKEPYERAVALSTKFGPSMTIYDTADLMKLQKDIMWMKGASIACRRWDRNKQNIFHTDVLLVGKDIKHGEIVIGMKKSVNDYARIIPLHNKGVNFMTSVRFMAERKPSKFPLIAPVTLERMIQEKIAKLKTVEFVFCELSNKFNVVMDRLDIALPE